MGTEITKTRFQHICAASKDEFTSVCAEQMQGITLRMLCEEPNKYLSISTLAKDSNERAKIARVLQYMIGELTASINVSSNLKVSQFPTLASHIISGFSFMTLEAVYLCFRQIMLGDGDQIYRVDIPFICKRLREFDDEYYALFAKIRDDRHTQQIVGYTDEEYKVSEESLKEYYARFKRG